jgi:hypothetical protein
MNDGVLGLYVGLEWQNEMMECTSKDPTSAKQLVALKFPREGAFAS